MICLSQKRIVSTKDQPHGIAYKCSKVECEDHSAIQAPHVSICYLWSSMKVYLQMHWHITDSGMLTWILGFKTKKRDGRK